MIHAETDESDAADFLDSGISYTTDGMPAGEVSVKGWWGGAATEIIIPPTVENGGSTYSVTSIGDGAFGSNSYVESIEIPNSVTSIGHSAFQLCTNLKSIEIPGSVTSIGTGAFYNCSRLESVNILGNSLTKVADSAFSSCPFKFVNIPDSVTEIGNLAFFYCSFLESIDLPSGLKKIGDDAFSNCQRLESIAIPSGVTSIGTRAFANNGLTSVTIPDSVTSIGTEAFANCGSLESVVIPNGITSISTEAFANCGSLTSLIIPDSVTSIGTEAFANCGSLTSITIPDSVTNISSGAFANCSSIETMIVTGELVSGDTLASGVVDLYFTKGKQMKLPGATKTVVSLTLRDISSADYSPDDLDGKGGIGGSTERKLKLSDAKFVWNWALSKWESVYSVSGVLTVTGGSASAGGKTVSLIYLARIYDAVTEADGSYTIENVPKGAFGDITIAVGGYAQMATPSVTPLAADVTGNNITIVAVYTVIFTKGTGISEFAYIINGGFPIGYTESFSVKHGDSLRAIALPSEGYVFKTWSGYSGSSSNPLIVSAVSGDISLTASASQIPVPVPSSTSDTYYSITFSSGSYYTVYDTKGPVSSPITVTEGGSLTFRVQTSEGYSVSSPVISGNAKITPQTDGWYRISEIHSDIHVNVTVSAYSDSGEGPGEGSGDGDGSGNGSEENSGSRGSHSVLIIAVLLVCVLAIGIILFFLKRRKDDEEEDGR